MFTETISKFFPYQQRHFYSFWLKKCLSSKACYLKEKAAFFQLLWNLPEKTSLSKIYSLWFKHTRFQHLRYYCNATVLNSVSIIILTLILPELLTWLIPLLGVWLSLKQKHWTIILQSVACLLKSHLHLTSPNNSYQPGLQATKPHTGICGDSLRGCIPSSVAIVRWKERCVGIASNYHCILGPVVAEVLKKSLLCPPFALHSCTETADSRLQM